jgi:hypothetical protein
MMTKHRRIVGFGMALAFLSGIFAAGSEGALAPLHTAAAPPVDCAAVTAAYRDFFPIPLAEMVSLAPLAPGDNYDAFTDPASPFYLDFAKLRADLDTLATVPDAADASFGKASDVIPRYRRLVDLAEGNVTSGGNPFDDGSADGQRYFGLDNPSFLTDSVAITNAYSEACSGQ